MIKSLNTLFNELLSGTSNEQSSKSHTIELATAALMIEISLADDHIDEQEYTTISDLLNNNFELSKEEINELIELAEQEVDHAVSLYEFTKLINDQFDDNEKLTVIENLWRVAYADNVLDKYEEYYIRKVADLIYVPHHSYIKAKHKVAPE